MPFGGGGEFVGGGGGGTGGGGGSPTGPAGGDLAGTYPNPTLSGTVNVESIIRANTLDQMGTPAANVSWGSQSITNLGNALTTGAAAKLGQLPEANGWLPYVISGCSWTADSPGTTLLCSMTAGTVMINGVLLSVAAVTSRAFTANNDTYIDLQDGGSGAATISYTAVPNFTISPALTGAGTVLNTLRVGVISAGATAVAATGVGQGAITAVTNAATQPSTTVAAGSNGAAISATPLNVASATSFQSGGGLASVAHATGQTYVIQYTGKGATTLTGVTVIAGTPANTVTTGDVVSGLAPLGVSDMIGNPIRRTNQGGGGAIGSAYDAVAYTTTQTGVTPYVPAAPNQWGFMAPIIIPAGISRNIKVAMQAPNLSSSAVAGTSIVVTVFVGNPNSGGISVVTIAPMVKVASDADAVNLSGQSLSPIAPGTYYVQVATQATAAGTITLGSALINTVLTVELI